MASTRKDAQWQLAWEMTNGANLKWDKLTYAARQAVLDAAEAILNGAEVAVVQMYADKWNGKRV